MPGFVITPLGTFPPSSDDGFPRFIQFKVNGDDVGDTTVNTVDIIGDVTASLSSDLGTVTYDVNAQAAALSWYSTAGDYTFVEADADNGVAGSATSGTQMFTIPPQSEVDLEGASILVSQDGAAQVQIVAGDGVTLQYRSAAFNPRTAGPGAIISLVWRSEDVWIICGDMEAL